MEKKLDKYINLINKEKNKENIKIIVRELFEDVNIEDVDFNDIIYNYVIPKLKKLGVNMNYNYETNETNYERVLKENY